MLGHPSVQTFLVRPRTRPQYIAQVLTAAAVPPLAGLTVTEIRYPATFALCAAFPLAALGMVPVRDECAFA
jgi:hypothetical protein